MNPTEVFAAAGAAVAGRSSMIHIRHAAAAIASGLCEMVLITQGESG
jgi:acetyl-CoA acetyltransferase